MRNLINKYIMSGMNVMILNFIQEKKQYYIILGYTLSILLLGELLNKYIIFFIGIVAWSLLYYDNKKKYNLSFFMVKGLILSIPISFINVFGGSYGKLPISWYNIFLFSLSVYFIFKYLNKTKIHLNDLTYISMSLIIISFFPVIVSSNFLDAINQYFNMIISFILIIIGTNIKYEFKKEQKNQLVLDYILSTRIAAIGVIIQYFSLNILNVEIGNYVFFGNYRHAFGFLFTDYSFLSLYLVSGAIAVYFIKSKNTYNRYTWIFEMLFLLATSIITSARTGIVAFIIVFILYSLYRIIKYLKNGWRNAVSVIIINIALLLTIYFLVFRVRGLKSFSDSGRMNINYRAFNYFLENPIIGIGFGDTNYPGTIPHNIIFQSLAQGGLLYSIPLFLFIGIILWIAYKKDFDFFPIFLCIVLGSMFIPNIFDSRFLPVLLLVFILRISEDSYIPLDREFIKTKFLTKK